MKRTQSQSRIPMYAAVLFACVLSPLTAEAHLNSTGMGPIYDGLVHFLMSPEDLVPVLALALLSGLRGPTYGRRILFVLPGAWLSLSSSDSWGLKSSCLRISHMMQSTVIEVLSKIGFHSMRRTFITSMAERNVPLPVTMAMVGHVSPEMTKHYTFISSSAQRQAVELLDKPAERTPFVEVFVEKQENRQMAASKSLN